MKLNMFKAYKYIYVCIWANINADHLLYMEQCANPSFDISEVITTCKVNQLPGLHMAETLCGIFPSKVTAGNGGCISMP